MRALLAGLVLLAAPWIGCASEPLADSEESCSEVGDVSQPFKLGCSLPPLEPVTDSAAPDFGSVSCRMFAAWSAGSAECACAAELGLAPLDTDQQAFASARLAQEGTCSAPCCASLCFCELLQHAGEALAACQARQEERPEVTPPGWCYLEPALGFGTQELAVCDRRIRFFPDPRVDVLATIVCTGEP